MDLDLPVWTQGTYVHTYNTQGHCCLELAGINKLQSLFSKTNSSGDSDKSHRCPTSVKMMYGCSLGDTQTCVSMYLHTCVHTEVCVHMNIDKLGIVAPRYSFREAAQMDTA